MMEFYVVLA